MQNEIWINKWILVEKIKGENEKVTESVSKIAPGFWVPRGEKIWEIWERFEKELRTYV